MVEVLFDTSVFEMACYLLENMDNGVNVLHSPPRHVKQLRLRVQSPESIAHNSTEAFSKFSRFYLSNLNIYYVS